jgi:peptidoglycan/LPS O-acetylase OafA/YrhL
MPTFYELFAISLLLISFLVTGSFVLRKYSPSNEISTIECRDIQVDGLRALLAFGVMTYHYFAIRHLVNNGEVKFNQTSSLVQLLGSWTVPIFFAITAYLFGQRLTSVSKQTGSLSIRFLVGRFFRLVPTTFVACSIFLMLVPKVYFSGSSGGSPIYNWKVLVNAALSSIGQPSSGPKSSFSETWAWHVAGAPQWTLHYEWIFYLSLTCLPLLTFKKRNFLVSLLVIIILGASIQGVKDFFFHWEFMTWAFIPGLVVGLTKSYWIRVKTFKHPLTAIVALSLVLLSAFVNNYKVKIPANTLFLIVVISNNSFTRLLEAKLLRSLGETTYSFYLLHGLVQYATLKWIVTIPIARSMPEWLWWMTCALQVVFIVIIARLSFEYVELPGIKAGKLFYSWLMNLIERRAKWLLNWI